MKKRLLALSLAAVVGISVTAYAATQSDQTHTMQNGQMVNAPMMSGQMTNTTDMAELHKQMVEQHVKSGMMTQEQANLMNERMANMGSMMNGMMGNGSAGGMAGGMMNSHMNKGGMMGASATGQKMGTSNHETYHK